MKKLKYSYGYILPFLLLFCFCAEKDDVVRQKLDFILKDDLESIIEDVSQESLLDKPYFDILEYRAYDEGAYSRMAIVDFYFLKTVAMKITRKYRYHKRLGMWDRYHNKYYMIDGQKEANETKN